MFSFMISEFLTSIIFREGEHPVSYLGPHTTVAWLAGRAGCWPACHLIGPFLVVILSLRMESHSPTTTFQPKWKRDFFSPMPLPSTSLRGQPKTPSYWPTYYTKIWAYVWILLRKSDFNFCRHHNWIFLKFILKATNIHPCLCLVLHFVANPKRHHIGQPTTKIWAHVWILLSKSDFNFCRYRDWTYLKFILKATKIHLCLCLVLHFVANPKRHHIGQPTTY